MQLLLVKCTLAQVNTDEA